MMGELLKANLVAHFAYYRRSRLLLAFGLVFLFLTIVLSLPAFILSSHVQAFSVLQRIFSELNGLLILFSAALGLFLISSHLRARNLKMVFTKPCPPALWLGSAFLSAVLASLMINLVILVLALAVSLVYPMRVVGGLFYTSVDTFAASTGLIAYLMFLGVVMHPVIAVVFALIFSSTTFYALLTWTQAAIQAGSKSATLRVLKDVFYFFYMLLPMTHAFAKESERIEASLRVSPGEWHYAFYSLGYALALSALCYGLSLFLLQKKRLI
jgi:hypothetical protein